MKVAQQQARSVLTVRAGERSYSAATMVDVDELDVGDAERWSVAGLRWLWDDVRRLEGGVHALGAGDLVLHCVEHLLHALFQGERGCLLRFHSFLGEVDVDRCVIERECWLLWCGFRGGWEFWN